MRTSLPMATAIAIAIAFPAHAQKLPFRPDQTGVEWVLPFKKALAVAKEQERLLVIKPIAFGTDKDGGW